MDTFVRVNKQNIAALAPYFAASPNRICDNTLGVTYQWRDIFDTWYFLTGEVLTTRSVYPRIGPCYAVPLGQGDTSAAYTAMEVDAAMLRIPLRFACVGEEQLPLLAERYGKEHLRIEEKRDWADYLYDPAGFAYSGKRFHTQKNHVNHFYKEFPEAKLEPVTDSMMPEIEAFLQKVITQHPEMSNVERQEVMGTLDLIEHKEALQQLSACLRTRLGITAISVGERQGDTLYVHGEKADAEAAGAFPSMAQAFVEYAGAGMTYVNREDDAGDPGIRYSKEQYRPVQMLKKYLVTVD